MRKTKVEDNECTVNENISSLHTYPLIYDLPVQGPVLVIFVSLVVLVFVLSQFKAYDESFDLFFSCINLMSPTSFHDLSVCKSQYLLNDQKSESSRSLFLH